MPKSLIKTTSIWGAVFVIFAGALIHFLYDWSGSNFLVGLIAPINESPWEHMKLVFTPLILFGFVEYYYLRGKVTNYCFALLKEAGVAILFILAVFYLYTSLTGESILVIDIASFVIGVAVAKYLGYKILTGSYKKYEFRGLNTISAILLTLIAGFFIYATLNPPHINLFEDPNTQAYGIYEKN